MSGPIAATSHAADPVVDLPTAPISYDEAPRAPKPRRRLWRTLLRRPRPLRRFAPRLPFSPATAHRDAGVAQHWGEQILVEDVVSVMHRDGTVSWLRHFATWLFGSTNLAEWDELYRNFDSRREIHRVMTAKLYPAEGKPLAARRTANVFSVAGSRANRYGRALGFQFHPLRPGVVVEFEDQYDEFVVERGGPMLISQFFLSTGYPCLHRRFTLAVAEPFPLQYRVHNGCPEPRLWEESGYRIATWEQQGIDGVPNDNWNPPARDYAPWIDVSTVRDWGGFARQLRNELLWPDGATAPVRQLARELSADKTTPLAKAQSVYSYAARKVRYGRPPAEQQARNTRPAGRVFEDLRGDCKDKSSLLIELLRVLDIEAELAVILTADEGRAPYLPSARFNHAIVCATIDGRRYWLDAASGLFSFGELPDANLDVTALMLDGKRFRFDRIPIPSGDFVESRRTWSGRIDEHGDYAGELHVESKGEMAARIRAALIDKSDEHRVDALRAWFGNDYPGFEADDFRFSDPEDLTQPLVCTCGMKRQRFARRVQDAVLATLPWFGSASMSGPFASTLRRQPLVVPVLYRIEEVHVIEMPAGSIPLAVPAEVSQSCPWGDYHCRIAVDGRRIDAERQLSLAGRFVPADQFSLYRDFWQQAHWSDTNPVVMTHFDANR